MPADPPAIDPVSDHTTPRPGKIYRGWVMTAACFVMAFFAWGVGFYGHGFFIAALRAERGWPTGTLSAAVASFWFVAVPAALLAGRLLDRHGPRWVVLYGALAMGGGAILVGQATQIWQIFVLFMFMGSAYPALATAAISASLVPWFERRLGLALGLALTGASAGGMLLPPLLVQLTAVLGFAAALACVGGAIMVLVVPLALFVLRRPRHEAETAGERERPAAQTDENPGTSIGDFLAAPAFWRIAAASTLSLAAQVGFLMHQLPSLEAALGLSGAAFAVSLTAGSAVAGRFVLGGLSHRVPLPILASGCYLLQGAGIALLLLGQGTASLYAGAALAGLSVGCIVMLPPLLLNQAFGADGYGTAYGLTNAIMFLGASMATATTGALHDMSGNFQISFACLVLMHLAAVAIILWRRPGA
ncbi:MAG: MFS transporter [Alphaproteobacteria bacterium]|nr:MFS transporter [Alphaproteobacteria bacterium]